MNDRPPEHTAEWAAVPLYTFWQPRYWPTWIGLGVMRLAIMLPFRWQLWLGRYIGKLLYRVLPKRRRIAAVNIALCFPELDDEGVDLLVRRNFESLGFAAFELCLGWWVSDARAKRLVRLEGTQHVTHALEQGGVILVSGHLLAQELACRPLNEYAPGISALFRPGRNPFMNEILKRSRGRTAHRLIAKEDIRTMIRTLREGKTVWYASDQAYKRKGSALVPFFDIPAMTSLALSDIARLGRAKVLPFFPLRQADGSGYLVEIQPPLDNFPSDDSEADALRIHHLLEERIRQAPEQYYWVHRRFKDRPPEYPDPYHDIHS